MKVVVLGAGGIIGQQMLITVPPGVYPVFTRTAEPNHLYEQLNLEDGKLGDWLFHHDPDIIINLAGENRPDVVEKDWALYQEINVEAVRKLGRWCDTKGKHLIHISSQAALDPVNQYGKQKFAADYWLENEAQNWAIVRPTYVLGIRPFPGIGRENPAERMLSGKEVVSVDDRYFAVSFAWDVADYIWKLCLNPIVRRQLHYVGNWTRFSRYELASILRCDPAPVKHADLPGLAPRPLDTSAPYHDAHCSGTMATGLMRLSDEYESRQNDDLTYRAKELAAFLRLPYQTVETKLSAGFGLLHNAVTEDFNRVNPVSDQELFKWYMGTDAYIWELTAYHSDAGFNYAGMVGGIAAALKSKGVERVLCLGDGTGDLSLAIAGTGMKAIYNDLRNSRTDKFAQSRFLMRHGDRWGKKILACSSGEFAPFFHTEEYCDTLDAVVSLDFLEHVPNVEEWVKAIYYALKPGGYFVAQNAFNMGSGPQGAMPMHLSVNDHYDRDWDPLLFSLGFVQLKSNWYRKPL